MLRKSAILLVLGLAAWVPQLLAADIHVVIREFDVPTPDSRPHDPEAAPDGALWYTGQLANKLGRLDPKTGAIKEFPVKRPDSGPHGLAADNAGNIWFTAIPRATSGSSTRRRASSRNIRCRTRASAIRTVSLSTATG